MQCLILELLFIYEHDLVINPITMVYKTGNLYQSIKNRKGLSALSLSKACLNQPLFTKRFSRLPPWKLVLRNLLEGTMVRFIGIQRWNISADLHQWQSYVELVHNPKWLFLATFYFQKKGATTWTLNLLLFWNLNNWYFKYKGFHVQNVLRSEAFNRSMDAGLKMGRLW